MSRTRGDQNTWPFSVAVKEIQKYFSDTIEKFNVLAKIYEF